MIVTVKVEGLKGVEDALANAGPKLAKRALKKALAAGSDIFLEEAKQRAPVLPQATAEREPGELRDAIAQVIHLSPKDENGIARVGLKYGGKGTQDPGVYGLFVEFGTKEMAAEPYMRPAYDVAKREAERIFTEEIRRGVESLKA